MIEARADRASLERAGRAAFPGFRLQTLALTTSTQDVARAAARSGAAAGFCCVANAQSSGRGRQQRTWVAPPHSSLLASVLVRVLTGRLGGVPIATGLAARAAIESTSRCQARLKWPNDIVVDGRKLAGILCEVEPASLGAGTAVVVGLGVNVRVPSFPAGVAGVSLHELVATPPASMHLLAALLPQLSARLELLEAGGMSQLRDEWMDHAAGLGQMVVATSAAGQVRGVAEGIDDDGALLVSVAGGSVRVLAGDVHIEPGEVPA